MASMERWHIGKTITFGNMLTGLAAVVAISLWLFDQQQRITILEVRADATDASVAAVHSDIQGMSSKIMGKLEQISDKQYYHLENHAPTAFSGGGGGSVDSDY